MLLLLKLHRWQPPRVLLFLLLLLFFKSNLGAQGYQLAVKQEKLENVLALIEAQSNYRFLYTVDHMRVAKPVTLNLTTDKLEQLLDRCFENQPLLYAIDGKVIVISHQLLNPTKAMGVRGRVVDDEGVGVPGISVSVKGTSLATATDNSGRFYFSNLTGPVTVVLSGAEIAPMERGVTGLSELLITVEKSTALLEETVVKGYYSTTKTLNTGTVGKLTAAEIARQPVANPLAALQGRVSGVLITQASGLPGAQFTVQIRGRNSIQSGNEPLYIVDGVIYNSDNLTRAASNNVNNPFSSLVPDDIDRIEVLKDADATSLYGSRGANGVILITTKRGKTGKARIEGAVSQGWGRPSQLPQMLNREQFLELRREAFANDGITPTALNGGDIVLWDTTQDRDWEKILVGKAVRQTNAQVRLSGGSELNTYSVGANYYRESTLYSTDLGNNRMAFSTALSSKSKDGRIQFSLSSIFAHEENELPVNDPYGAIRLAPHAPDPHTAEGEFNWGPPGWSFVNPIADQLRRYKSIVNRMNTSGVLSVGIWKDLRFKISGGVNFQDLEENSLNPIRAQNPVNNPRGSTLFANSRSQSWITESQVDYSKRLGNDTKLNALVGFSLQQSSRRGSTQTGSGYTSDLLIHSIAGAGLVNVQDSRSEYKYRALFARIELNNRDKYVINLTGRRDGSSRFAPQRQYANFGAIGAAWILTAEPWLANSPILSFAKIRASYGLVGNDQIGDYQFYDAYLTTTYPYNNQPGLQPARLYNPDYSWEQKSNIDLGVELAFLSNRVLLNGTYFRSRSGNQIIQYSLPTQTGMSGILNNFPGLVQNTGLEVDVTSRNLVGKKFKWSTTANLTVARNKLLEFPGLATSSYASTYAIGQPLDIVFLYAALGVDPQTGLYTFEDANRDGAINNADRLSIGTRVPRYFGGLGNDLSYNQWSLSVFVQFVAQKGNNPLLGATPLGATRNVHISALDRWRTPGDITTYQRYTVGIGPAAQAASLASRSTASLVNADFARLKNIQLAYTFNDHQLVKLKASTLSIFCQAQNLFTLTSFKAADPENQSALAIPPLRMMTIGVRVAY